MDAATVRAMLEQHFEYAGSDPSAPTRSTPTTPSSSSPSPESASSGLLTIFALAFSATAAQAIPLPGTPEERANTTTPLPPDGDQCSYSPDTLLDNMREECDEQNTGFGSSIPEEACKFAAEDYYTVVASISAVRDVGAPGG